MRTLIVTVGTSLLGNAKRDLKTSELSDQQLANYLRHNDPVKTSAEMNSLSRLLKEGDALIFLHSQTAEGKLCADSLRRHYQNGGYEADVREVANLSYAESSFKLRGLRSLVSTLIELIRAERAKGRTVIMNATGGFKAEIAYATLVGLLFDVPVYYIHEVFQDIIEMPATPIGWDFELLFEHEDVIEWLFEDAHPSAEVDVRLRGRPADLRLLLAEENGLTTPSPAAYAFYEAFQDAEARAQGVTVMLSQSAHDTWDAADANTRELFARTLRKLKMASLRRSGSDRVGNCDCLVFPKGHRNERMFYFEDDAGQLCVCELARHSDLTYERLIKRGVMQTNYNNFTKWLD